MHDIEISRIDILEQNADKNKAYDQSVRYVFGGFALTAIFFFCINAMISDQFDFFDGGYSWNANSDPFFVKSCAIVLFGLYKNVSTTWPSVYKNVVSQDECESYDIYTHFYTDVKSTSNHRNNEHNVSIDSMQTVLQHLGSANYAMIRDIFYDSSLESEVNLVWVDNAFDSYNNHHKSIRNMIYQATSLKFSCELMKHSHRPYSRYIFIRSDLFVWDNVLYPSMVKPHEVYVPEWHSWGGMNDRFMISDKLGANMYCQRGFAYKLLLTSMKPLFYKRNHMMNAEALLHLYMTTHGINVVEMPASDFPIMIRYRGECGNLSSVDVALINTTSPITGLHQLNCKILEERLKELQFT